MEWSMGNDLRCWAGLAAQKQKITACPLRLEGFFLLLGGATQITNGDAWWRVNGTLTNGDRRWSWGVPAASITQHVRDVRLINWKIMLPSSSFCRFCLVHVTGVKQRFLAFWHDCVISDGMNFRLQNGGKIGHAILCEKRRVKCAFFLIQKLFKKMTMKYFFFIILFYKNSKVNINNIISSQKKYIYTSCPFLLLKIIYHSGLGFPFYILPFILSPPPTDYAQRAHWYWLINQKFTTGSGRSQKNTTPNETISFPLWENKRCTTKHNKKKGKVWGKNKTNKKCTQNYRPVYLFPCCQTSSDTSSGLSPLCSGVFFL